MLFTFVKWKVGGILSILKDCKKNWGGALKGLLKTYRAL